MSYSLIQNLYRIEKVIQSKTGNEKHIEFQDAKIKKADAIKKRYETNIILNRSEFSSRIKLLNEEYNTLTEEYLARIFQKDELGRKTHNRIRELLNLPPIIYNLDPSTVADNQEPV